VLKAVAGKDKEKLKGAEILFPVIAPVRVARKKISKDQEPEDGATYALIEDSEVASSISVGSSVSNTGRGKKRMAADDESLEAERCGGGNRVFPLMRFGPEHEEYTGQGGEPRVVRRVRAMDDLEGDDGAMDSELGEDFARDLFHFIQSSPQPWTNQRIFVSAAEGRFRGINECVLKAHISTMLLTMRKTAQHLMNTSVASGTPEASSRAAVIHLNMEAVTQFTSID